MFSLILAFLAITFALLIGFAVTRSAYQPKAFRPDLDMLRRDIERAERSHKRRKHLRKDYVEAVRKELCSEKPSQEASPS